MKNQSKLQTLDSCKYVFRGQSYWNCENDFYLKYYDADIYKYLVVLGYDSFELKVGELSKRAWHDKHGNIIVRFSRHYV